MFYRTERLIIRGWKSQTYAVSRGDSKPLFLFWKRQRALLTQALFAFSKTKNSMVHFRIRPKLDPPAEQWRQKVFQVRNARRATRTRRWHANVETLWIHIISVVPLLQVDWLNWISYLVFSCEPVSAEYIIFDPPHRRKSANNCLSKQVACLC